MKHYIFVCDKIPNVLTVHSVLSTIYNKRQENVDLPYKIWQMGKTIHLISDDPCLKLDNMQFNHYATRNDKIPSKINVKLLSVTNEPQNCFQNGNRVVVSGIMSYGTHVGENSKLNLTDNDRRQKNISPVQLNGELNPTTKEIMKRYLEDRLGITVNLNYVDKATNFIPMKDIICYQNGNVYRKITNVFALEIIGEVVDSGKTSNLSCCSIGRKRSYGLGNIMVKQYHER